MKTVGASVFGSLWALEWAWQPAEINLRSARSSRIYAKYQISSL